MKSKKIKQFNLNKLLKEHININGSRVSGYFLSHDKTHCFCMCGGFGLYEFIETNDKNFPFVWIRLQ